MVQCIFFALHFGRERGIRRSEKSQLKLWCFNYEQPQESMFTKERLPTWYLKIIGCKFIVVTGKSNFLSYLRFNSYRMLPKGKKWISSNLIFILHRREESLKKYTMSEIQTCITILIVVFLVDFCNSKSWNSCKTFQSKKQTNKKTNLTSTKTKKSFEKLMMN